MSTLNETVRLLNIDRFKKQLDNPAMPEENRKLIVKLLAEQEAKAPPHHLLRGG